MKKSFLTLLSLIITLSLWAQPTREWATYSTGIGFVKYDKSSSYLYCAGGTELGIPTVTPNCFQDTINGGSDAYLAKFDTSGNRVWATYFGGNGYEKVQGMAITSSGNTIITGMTNSNQGLVTMGSAGSQSPTFNSYFVGQSAFIAKFDTSGNRLWSRYFGDSIATSMREITCDQDNNIIVAGTGAGFFQIPASTNSFQQYPIPTDSITPISYLAKFDGITGEVIWWTYYSGTSFTLISSVTCDRDNNIFIAGATGNASGFSTPNAYVPVGPNAFLAKFSPTGQRVWATYYPSANKIVSDGDSLLYTLGQIADTGWASAGAFQTQPNGGSDLFLSSINAITGYPNWGTYFGMEVNEYNSGITLNKAGDIFISGNTLGVSNNPQLATPCSLDGGKRLAFMAKFDKTGDRKWSTYYDLGLGYPAISPIATGEQNDFYITAWANGPGLATPGAFQDSSVGLNALMVKLQDTLICTARDIQITQQDSVIRIPNDFAVYTWYKNGIALNNSDTNFLVFDDPNADYFVMVKDICGCEYTSDTYHPSATSVSSLRNNGWDLVIYPNPNNGAFQLKGITKSGNQSLSFIVSDISGRSLIKGNFKTKGKIIDHKVDCGSLNPGIYFIVLSDGIGKSVLKFVVK